MRARTADLASPGSSVTLCIKAHRRLALADAAALKSDRWADRSRAASINPPRWQAAAQAACWIDGAEAKIRALWKRRASGRSHVDVAPPRVAADAREL